MGCKRGKTKEELLQALIPLFEQTKVNLKSISKISTVEVKKDEIGLIELARFLKVPLEIIGLEAIRNIQYQFDGSDFVEKTIGVTSVSEPCGYLSSNKGQCVMRKVKSKGITLSLWKDKEEIE